MMQPETSSSHALQSQPSLVLLAPMPRRPIALVARTHHHHHHHSSRSRSSRTVSNGDSPDSSKHSAAQPTATSPDSQFASGSTASTVRLVGHPYSRAKTPSNATNTLSNPVSPAAAAALVGANGWPLGLGISPVSPPPRSRAASRQSMASRPLSRLSCSRENATVLAPTVDPVTVDTRSSLLGRIVDDQGTGAHHASSADQPMLASPIASSAVTSAISMMHVERTPTKRNGRAQTNVKQVVSPIQARPHAAVNDDDQEPRSTPTIGATSPRPDDIEQNLNVSPAAASASAQLPLSLSSPPLATSPANAAAAQKKAAIIPDRINATSASLAPSPCLSESHSRSPTASPSPCPSPSFSTLSDLPESGKQGQQQHRKSGLPLPPVPTSPIPRKMTRNPFERYITARDSSSCSGNMSLHARLAMAMAQGNGRFGHLAIDGEDRDEEMCLSSPTLYRPAFVSVNSNNSAGSRMDMDD